MGWSGGGGVGTNEGLQSIGLSKYTHTHTHTYIHTHTHTHTHTRDIYRVLICKLKDTMAARFVPNVLRFEICRPLGDEACRNRPLYFRNHSASVSEKCRVRLLLVLITMINSNNYSDHNNCRGCVYPTDLSDY